MLLGVREEIEKLGQANLDEKNAFEEKVVTMSLTDKSLLLLLQDADACTEGAVDTLLLKDVS